MDRARAVAAWTALAAAAGVAGSGIGLVLGVVVSMALPAPPAPRPAGAVVGRREADGPPGPLAWRFVTPPPAGLRVDAATGALLGTPSGGSAR